MNLLPDMIIIDFCEWLKKKLVAKQCNYDFLDLMLDEEYRSALRKYAKEYLYVQRYLKATKRLLHRFIDSDDFEQCFSHRERFIDYGYFDITDLLHHIHYARIENGLHNFIEKEYGRQITVQDIVYYEFAQEREIESSQLADSTSYVFSHARSGGREKKWVLQLMNRANLELDIEVDFLEWLIQTSGEPIDFRKMPMKTFELLASKFQIECSKTENEKRKLIKSFKQTNYIVLSEKLATVLPSNTAKRAKDLGYIFCRYQDKRIRFKCFIVPLQADADEYIDLMENRWYDLHYLSGDYLDIYYSKTDYGKSGYQIANQMSLIPNSLKTKAPIIVLWENHLEDAQGIDISRLDNIAMFEVIRCIVNSIRDGQNIDQIVKEANQMSKKLRDEQRPVNRNTLTIGGNAVVNGPVAVVNDHGEMISNVGQKTDDANVLHELEKAKAIIRNFSEMNDRQKQLLNEIIDETKNAIKEDSVVKKEASKKRFKDAVDLIGIGSKLISALSGLANVLKFFGVSPT